MTDDTPSVRKPAATFILCLMEEGFTYVDAENHARTMFPTLTDDEWTEIDKVVHIRNEVIDQAIAVVLFVNLISDGVDFNHALDAAKDKYPPIDPTLLLRIHTAIKKGSRKK